MQEGGGRRRWLAKEAIPDSTYRLDELPMARRRERVAQAANVDVDGALFDEDMIAPDLVQELAAAEGAARMGHEEVQELELDLAKIDLAVAGPDAACCRVEAQRPNLEHLVGKLW